MVALRRNDVERSRYQHSGVGDHFNRCLSRGLAHRQLDRMGTPPTLIRSLGQPDRNFNLANRNRQRHLIRRPRLQATRNRLPDILQRRGLRPPLRNAARNGRALRDNYPSHPAPACQKLHTRILSPHNPKLYFTPFHQLPYFIRPFQHNPSLIYRQGVHVLSQRRAEPARRSILVNLFGPACVGCPSPQKATPCRCGLKLSDGRARRP